MKLLSQRDTRWANIKLGTSNQTIGGYGCTITCLAMILDTTPDVVNDKLLSVNGYASGNLVIWDKIKEAFPGAEVHRVWNYNNDDVLANVPNVLVEVDGTPIGGYKHWVVYIGNHKLNDPWDGTKKPTSSYPNPLSYCVVKSPKPTSDFIPVEKKTFEELVSKASSYDNFVNNGYDSVQKVKDTIEGYQSRVTTVERERDSAKGELTVAKEKQKQAEKALANYTIECQREMGLLNDRIAGLTKDNPDIDKLRADYESQIGVLKDSIVTIQKKLDTASILIAKLKQPLIDLSFIERLILLFGGGGK